MNIFQQLLTLLPILAQMSGNKNAQLAAELIEIAEEEIRRRMQDQNRTRAEVLADADATWSEAIQGADELAALGHGNGE